MSERVDRVGMCIYNWMFVVWCFGVFFLSFFFMMMVMVMILSEE